MKEAGHNDQISTGLESFSAPTHLSAVMCPLDM